MPLSTQPKVIYKAAVIGAGPAGLACISSLIEKYHETPTAAASANLHPKFLWIDREDFQGGRLGRYSQVPSNTRVNLFLRFAQVPKAFATDGDEGSSVLKEMETQLDPSSGCKLKWPARLCRELSEGLRKKYSEDVCEFVGGEVVSLDGDGENWRVRVKDGTEEFICEEVYLATGSQPRSPAQSASLIPLDDALNPDALKKLLGSNSTTIHLYGSSHSAMLVLMNLISGENQPHKVMNIYRSPLCFAEYSSSPQEDATKIINDNTGLKGDVATWVKSWYSAGDDLEAGRSTTYFNGKLTRVHYLSSKVLEAKEAEAAKEIWAIGYDRNPLPQITYKQNLIVNPEALDYTAKGQLLQSQTTFNGLFGFGIAFPERIMEGEKETVAVGMWKFLRHARHCIIGENEGRS